ncbi:uncharacterized protein LOC107269114 [Cephus cinctus]|uniref:Glycosyltransferase family 92 protein n=1 Tax=Cephus cinctus TaxID=211228 RepID=A0AAJ7BZH3_CEPCN|nr:uncharacterized protein LOC107269114 [Cephus cinctus]XP_015598098.1 uncharacterized protein LOC107269114 [Cephus cinctus]XP_015598099.1 uncharacterized protein LOC107269114 [Cephus cinctus]XP_015598100.1 uncharacterized protein LOC107269114 [Cephus cinctus]XP_015598101.1 uncharacterized protein LOC107269114 [Cephus cinctus]XP_024942142.1 uncharacterized protein LOC107269114 [Cephus cinctus]
MKTEVIYTQLNNPHRTGNCEIVTRTVNYRATSKMRKYYQAALVIIATVSVVSLLFYRHEYNRLRYVLEVLNFFGKPGRSGVDTNCTKSSAEKKFDFHFDIPVSSWQRLDNELYVYSAYSSDAGEVRAIGIGKVNNNLNLTCNIFFEGNIEPFPGYFVLSPIKSVTEKPNNAKQKYIGYELLCQYEGGRPPIAISFLNRNEKNHNDVAILPVTNPPVTYDSNNSVICIAPPMNKPMSTADMISFLNFHELIGMDNFIVYDYGIPNTFNEALKNMAQNPSPYWKFTYTTLPWNFPFTGVHPNIVRDIIQADCLHRTYNKVMYVTTLSWEEYIVLKYHHLVADLLFDFGKNTWPSYVSYKLNTSVFCTEQKDDKRATKNTPIVLRKTHKNKNIIVNRPVYLFKRDALQRNDLVTEQNDAVTDLMFINRYQHCNRINDDTSTDTYDNSILRFAGDMQNAPIFKQYVTGKIFSSN